MSVFIVAAETSDDCRFHPPPLVGGHALAGTPRPWFFLVYGFCNAFTSHRANVGSLYFAWERHIPFVPAMIVPYLSIDLFFAGSFFSMPFAVRTAGPRPGGSRWPSRFRRRDFCCFRCASGGRVPPWKGGLGTLFAPLNSLDQPYNLCPSLHISLRALLWDVYGRHTRPYPVLRRLCAGWFLLIGLSTLLVYQHHVIDLLGGYLVALLCRAAISEEGKPAWISAWRSGRIPRPTQSLRRSLPPSWRRSSSSSPAAACAGPAANQAPGNACYFANHTSHLDALVVWAALRPEARALARPVAARDYWLANPLRRYLATRVFHTVLIDRHRVCPHARNPIAPLLAALENGRRHSLILFPEGSRGHRPRSGSLQERSLSPRQTPAGRGTGAGAHRQHEPHPPQRPVATRADARRPEFWHTPAPGARRR